MWRQVEFDAVDDVANEGQIALDKFLLIDSPGGPLVDAPGTGSRRYIRDRDG
jgi:hypothetical protein